MNLTIASSALATNVIPVTNPEPAAARDSRIPPGCTGEVKENDGGSVEITYDCVAKLPNGGSQTTHVEEVTETTGAPYDAALAQPTELVRFWGRLTQYTEVDALGNTILNSETESSELTKYTWNPDGSSSEEYRRTISNTGVQVYGAVNEWEDRSSFSTRTLYESGQRTFYNELNTDSTRNVGESGEHVGGIVQEVTEEAGYREYHYSAHFDGEDKYDETWRVPSEGGFGTEGPENGPGGEAGADVGIQVAFDGGDPTTAPAIVAAQEEQAGGVLASSEEDEQSVEEQ